MNDVLDLSPQVAVLPVVHGSGDFALEVCRRLRTAHYDTLAVALPASYAAELERGVSLLPRISVVLQPPLHPRAAGSYVPVDPCQPVIAAIRAAMEADIDRAYVDLETDDYEPYAPVLPDASALGGLSLERFLTALLPALAPPLPGSQRLQRLRRMAYELHRLELDQRRVVLVAAAADWPWLRQAYRQRAPVTGAGAVTMPRLFDVTPSGLYFLLGELPWLTHLYEHRRAELIGDGSLAVDGIRALLLQAREACSGADYLPGWLTTQSLALLLRYVRNLTLCAGRLAPDLHDVVVAAQQVVGDDYALAVIESARQYPPQGLPTELEAARVGAGVVFDREGRPQRYHSRLELPPRTWRRLRLRPTPPPARQQQWRRQWDPYGQCSHLPEDRRVESFQHHVRDQAKALVGAGATRSEPFTASLKDGLDLRETLRHWWAGDIYVREVVPTHGTVEVVVFLFDHPADPQRYPWRATWYAEHDEESTLCFFATDFGTRMVGPGIAQAVYGGCFFLFPPRPIPDIWEDPRFDWTRSPEERLLAGALYHSRERRVALVAPRPPSAAWRALARQARRQWVYLPLRRFSPATVDRLRRFHVLNGKHVRSYAARFIRDLR